MDHYKVLGLTRNSSKDEIKEAFRKLAMQFHPDKHSHSSKSARDHALLKFKQVKEAYDVLIDDRKRADYNIWYSNNSGRASGFGSSSSGYGYGNSSYGRTNSPGYGYGYSSYGKTNSGYDSSYHRRAGNGGAFASRLEIAFQYLTTRAFLLNLAFAGAIYGGVVVFESSRDALWKMQNSGKSFEDAMKSIEKAKGDKGTPTMDWWQIGKLLQWATNNRNMALIDLQRGMVRGEERLYIWMEKRYPPQAVNMSLTLTSLCLHFLNQPPDLCSSYTLFV